MSARDGGTERIEMTYAHTCARANGATPAPLGCVRVLTSLHLAGLSLSLPLRSAARAASSMAWRG
jgi:hypothetical protein